MKDDIAPLLVLASICVFFVIEAIVARRNGNRSLIRRILLTLQFIPFSEKKDPHARWDRRDFRYRASQRKSTRLSHADDGLSLPDIVITAAVGVLVFKAAQKGYSFLKGLDWDSLAAEDQAAIEHFAIDAERIRHNGDRLDRAESLVSMDDRLSVEVGAFLVSATLEGGLKQLREQHDITLTEEEAEGMVGVASALKNHGVVSAQEYGEIRRYVSTVRNKVMHGEFGALDSNEVEEQIRFTRGFLDKHRLV